MTFDFCKKIFCFLMVSLITLGYLGCGGSDQEEVTLYTALDQIYSEPLIQEFEKRTGINVKPVYDVEAVKTTGLVNRIVAEKKHPTCDVFWNNEIIRTLYLKDKGLLAAYHSPSANDLPTGMKDKEGYWHGFAARARIIVANPAVLGNAHRPSGLTDMIDSKWKGRFGLAYPLFGTTSTHAAVLWSEWGGEKATQFYSSVKDNGANILTGNAVACRSVASGEFAWAWTDTDDAHGQIVDGKKLEIIFPDQDGMGALLIPNSVCLIKDCPNPEAGKKLIDYLLSPEVEIALSKSRSAQIPVRPSLPGPPGLPNLEEVKWMKADYSKAAAKLEESSRKLEELFKN
jgi:iron(III) transport system substrate-binding protein